MMAGPSSNPGWSGIEDRDVKVKDEVAGFGDGAAFFEGGQTEIRSAGAW
jgi:hypothetical protein